MYRDIAIFDPTYQTNSLLLPFVPFLGLDNNGKTICFGAAIVENETAASLTWVFNQFCTAMGTYPITIFTDDCPSIAKAIRDSFPNTTHRICM